MQRTDFGAKTNNNLSLGILLVEVEQP